MFDLSESVVDPVAATELDTVPIDKAHRLVPKLVQCKVCSTQCVCVGANTAGVEVAKFEKLIDHWPPVPKEKYVTREGDPFDGALLVRSGSVKTCQTLSDGEEHITGFYFPGEVFGLDGFANSSHVSSAIAMETTSLCLLPLQRLLSGRSEKLSIEARFLELLSELLKRKDDHALMLAKNRAHVRLAAFILDLSRRFERRHLSARCLYLPMSRTDVSRYLGLSLESISRSFAVLEKDQLIKSNGRMIELTDRMALESLAGISRESQRETA